MLGVYYDSNSSQRHECSLQLNHEQLITLIGIEIPPVPLSKVCVSPRIGDSSRFITFPDDAVFETQDNDAVDALLLNHSSNHRWFIIHYWERNKKLILLSMVSLAGIIYLLLAFAIPLMSRAVAYSLPTSVSTKLAGEVLERLDERVLSPTELAQQRQSTLQNQFAFLTAGLQDFRFTLRFRKGNMVGANAFALPDGTIVMTDELVALADNDFELQSVLLHEIGHVVNRHSLRQLIENSSSALLVIWLTGDIEAGSSWFATLPTLLLHASYSRDIEWEADAYALEQMRTANISPQYFADLMKKLDTANLSPATGNDKRADGNSTDNAREKSTDDWLDYISTHPPTVDRIKRFEGAAIQ